MSTTTSGYSLSPSQPLAESPSLRSLFDAHVELTKARLSSLVLLTTAVGYVLAGGLALDGARLVWTLLGAGLAALGVGALNQCLERGRDARMLRTQQRPLVSGQLGMVWATVLGLSFGAIGPTVLLIKTTGLAAGLTLLCEAVYLLAYTPLKTRTTLNTFVGAICGALPPMIGWAAVRGTLEPGAWVLGLILFIWQIPHFVSLAWLYREDYARGGFQMLSLADLSGRLTGRVALLHCAALLPAVAALSMVGVTGRWFAAGGALLTLGLAWLSLGFLRTPTPQRAKRLFLGSVLYLPLLLALMVVDRPAARGHDPARVLAVDDFTPIHAARAAAFHPGMSR